MTTTTTTTNRAGDGRGATTGVVEAAREWITDTPTAAGLYPFGRKGHRNEHGVPLGVDVHSGHIACYDPYTAFQAGEQRAAQLAVLATNGAGKSALIKKLVTGLAARGLTPIVPADFKGEYLPLIGHLGGTSLTVDRTGGLGLLDPGGQLALAAATGAPTRVLDELKARRGQTIATVAGIARNQPLTAWETTAISAAADLINPTSHLADLADTMAANIAHLATILRRPPGRTETLLEPLILALAALADGPIGAVLGQTPTAEHVWTANQPLALDTSAIPIAEGDLSAAVLVTAWSAALSTIYLANTIKPTPRVVVFDEIWRATRQHPALANELGALMRMDRHDGLITIIATHSWTDTEQPGGSNILDRCAAYAIGGLNTGEADHLATAGIGLNQAELTEIRANTTTTGQGRFLLKQGDHPGRAIQTILTPTETRLSHTNQKWTQP